MKKTLPLNAVLLPDNAKRAFKGAIFDVYQWPQKMFDGTTKTFEMLKRPDTVQIIAVQGDKILLVDDEQPGRAPRIHFPGGRADSTDASWLAAAQRELREETGLVCKEWRLIDVAQPIIKAEWFAPIFLATTITDQGGQELDLDGEKITMQWHKFDAVRQAVLKGDEQMMSYLVPFFNHVTSLEQLLAAPEFTGTAVDR
jgi:ADP-ribose pyrophosphatase